MPEGVLTSFIICDAYCYFVGQTRHTVGHTQTCLLQQSDIVWWINASPTTWRHWWAFSSYKKI